ncbi:sulfite exporter TauE/SafE family protein [Sphingomicrobium clamense]|uniref:Probable membrane transporter protein n=1 Tax=Sphingomicrobium clamense TaxID=2851013 RepID=A0ABS6V6V7_9SPHN|nr:sulfite exporter TauE/SafE family protein [Sphingomicrobium sp. B8]MBW0145294.1 sulfite exporter TauE/SafE family protein [Sphingomicrobium sp. B8]
MDWGYWVSGGLSGVVIGFSLALIGGGGSILAVPLMMYVVGAPAPHIAIGTSALAVAANAATGLWNHARKGNVIWSSGLLFAGAGVVGAFLGSTGGKAFDGQKLLFLFAILMIVVGVLMLRRKGDGGSRPGALTKANAPKVGATGIGAGLASGFFGIGGGFLIVPGLIASTRMAMLKAVGTSLVGVTAFGLTTALNYARDGLVDWALAALFVAGGFIGSLLGTRAAAHLSSKGQLTKAFSGVIFVIAAYMLYRSGSEAF